MTDDIAKPAHYTSGKIEVREFIKDQLATHPLAQPYGFNIGNIIKYTCRAGRKGSALTDLKKAEQYLKDMITQLEGKN